MSNLGFFVYYPVIYSWILLKSYQRNITDVINCTSESQFEAVKMRITEKYKKTEKELLLKFRDASQENNVEQMQQMAETLSRKLFKT